jgi:aldehyde dehydrogenase (NAD+)
VVRKPEWHYDLIVCLPEDDITARIAVVHSFTGAYVAGKWTNAGDTSLEVSSPASGTMLGSVGVAGPSDVDAAVSSARAALDSGGWAGTDPAGRAAILGRIAAAISQRKNEFADLASVEIGSPRKWSTFGHVLTAVGVFDAYAAIAGDYPFESQRPSGLGGTVRVRQLPVGVVGAIIPWNTPLFIAALKLGPALAAGCTIVLKPSPDAPLGVCLLTEVLEQAGLPDGVVNIVNGGVDTGRALVAHPGVDKISFTGSTAAGAEIAATCASALRRCSTELGGKSAVIVLDDASLEDAVAGLVGGFTGNNGQLCAALTRILLPRSRYEEFTRAIVAAVNQLKIGDPADRSTDIGPVINAAARDRIEHAVERARGDGAKILIGGTRAPGSAPYVAPTVIATDNGSEIAREEVFGPVAVVIAYDDDDDAVAIANDSPYGLVGAVWSADADRAAAVATRLRTGSVAVNSSTVMDFGSPFGGFKRSGIGREGGPEGIAGYTELQAIIN